MFVSPAQQALGACTGRAEILQGCARLGVMAQWKGNVCVCISSMAGPGGVAGKAEIQGWGVCPVKQSSCRAVQAWGRGPGGDQKCLWIPGLKDSSHRDLAVLRGGSLG
jgi:hypothetical protein